MENKVRSRLYKYRGLKHPLQLAKNLLYLKKIYGDSTEGHAQDLNLKSWYKKFRTFIVAYPERVEVAFEFFKSNLIGNYENRTFSAHEVTLVCVEKNDLFKLKKNINHHRNIGIRQFIIIDNGSTDGTLEWLEMQEDVQVYQTEKPYTTNRREAWINQAIKKKGEDRWYVIVDSDELIDYPGSDNVNINMLVSTLSQQGYTRIRAVLLDMYAKSHFYKSNDVKHYIEECVFFDSNTYSFDQSLPFLDLLTGGPRKRIFNELTWCTKYPIVFAHRDFIQCNSHFPYPFEENKNTSCYVALKHYKFLPTDIEKYKKIAIAENYHNGSASYKRYVEVIESDNLNFMYEGSIKYNESNDLMRVIIDGESIIEKVSYDEK